MSTDWGSLGGIYAVFIKVPYINIYTHTLYK